MSLFNALGNFAGGAANTYFRNGLGDKWDERRKARELSDVTKEANSAVVEDKSINEDDISRANAEAAKQAAADKAMFSDTPKGADVVVSAYVPDGAASKPVQDTAVKKDWVSDLNTGDYQAGGAAPVAKKEFAFMGKTYGEKPTAAQQDRAITDKIADTMRLQGDHKGAASLVANGYGLRQAKRTEENNEAYAAIPGQTLKAFEAKREEALKRGDDAGAERYQGFVDRMKKGIAEGETELAMRVHAGRVSDPATLEDLFNGTGELKVKKGTGRTDDSGTVYGELEDGRKVSMTKEQAKQHLIMAGKIKPEKNEFIGTRWGLLNKATGEHKIINLPDPKPKPGGGKDENPAPGGIYSPKEFSSLMGLNDSSDPETRAKVFESYSQYERMVKYNPSLANGEALQIAQKLASGKMQAKPIFDKDKFGWARAIETGTGNQVWIDEPGRDKTAIGIDPKTQREVELAHPFAQKVMDDKVFSNLEKAIVLAKKSGNAADIAQADRVMSYAQRVRGYNKSDPAEQSPATKAPTAQAPVFSKEELDVAAKLGAKQQEPLGPRIGRAVDAISSSVGGVWKQGEKNSFTNTLKKMRATQQMEMGDAISVASAIKSNPELKASLSAEELIAIQVAANTRL